MPEPSGTGPDEVARKEFATSFRGFDQHEVRVFLDHVAAELAASQARERSLEERLASTTAQGSLRTLGPQELERVLGLEMARVLQAAREAATEIRNRAEEHAAGLLREATEDARRMRAEAAAALAERRAEAERAAAALREEAEREVLAARAAAAAAAAEAVEVAEERGRQMVGEAQVVRERILRDLGRRRRLGQQHLEQLRAGRERMLEAYRGVQGALDAAMAQLAVSEPEARAAAETAGLRAGSEPELTLEELEAEVVAAVDAGLVVVPPPVPDEPVARALAPDGPPVVVIPEPAGPGAEPGDDDVDGTPAPATAEPRPEDRPPELPAEVAPAGPLLEHEVRPQVQVLRRRRRKGLPASVRTIDLGHQSEGVRLLPPDPPSSEADEPASARGVAAAAVDTVAGEEEEVEAAVPTHDEPAEPVHEDLAPSRVVAPGVEAGDVGPKADDLFARMRADRAATVAHAEEVLADQGADPAARTSATAGAGAPGRAATVRPGGAQVSTAPHDRDAAGAPGAGGDVTVGGVTPGRAATVGSGGARVPSAPDDRDAGGAPGAGGDVLVVAPEEVSDVPGAEAASLFERRDGALEVHERTLARALKRALADEQNSLLDDLRRGGGVPGIEVLLPDAKEHAGRYAEVVIPPLGAAAASGGKALSGGRVQAMASDLAGELVSGLRPRLARAIDGAAGDEGTATEALSAAYREWKTSRIEPIARHHALTAWAAGSFAATSGTELQWVVDPEVGCSPDCADNVLAGPTPKGEPFPTGQIHPPAHAGCRCLVVPPNR